MLLKSHNPTALAEICQEAYLEDLFGGECIRDDDGNLSIGTYVIPHPGELGTSTINDETLNAFFVAFLDEMKRRRWEVRVLPIGWGIDICWSLHKTGTVGLFGLLHLAIGLAEDYGALKQCMIRTGTWVDQFGQDKCLTKPTDEHWRS